MLERADLGDGWLLVDEDFAGDGLDVGVGHGEDVAAPFSGRGDVAEVEHALAGPGGVGGGGFKRQLALGNGEAFGAVEFAEARAVCGEVVDFAVDAFDSLGAAFGIKAGVDLEGARFIEKRDVTADLIAESALLAEFEKEPGAGGFTEHQAEQAQRVAAFGMAAGGVPGERELELIGLAAVVDMLGFGRAAVEGQAGFSMVKHGR